MFNNERISKIMFNGEYIGTCLLNAQNVAINRVIEFLMKNQTITRNSIAVNPLTCYNVSTGNVVEQFANNTLVKHGDNGFVGGDTLEVTYDYRTKTVGDVVNCPCRLFVSYTPTLQNPSNITGSPSTGWSEQSSQAETDKIKTQDGTSMVSFSTNNGVIAQQMLEIDLTPLCNQLFSGSNATLESAIKTSGIIADIWSMGSGSNASVLTNGCTVLIWNGATWVGSSWVNNTDSITKINAVSTNVVDKVSSSNKLYILVHATYPSNGTIPSSVSLDYAKVTIQLNRTVDVVAPKSVYLPKYWAMCGSFSPNFDNTKTGIKRVLSLFTDTNNRFSFHWNGSVSRFEFFKNKTGLGYVVWSTTSNLFNKNQQFRFIVGQNSSGMFMYLLKNNGSVEKVVNTDISELKGQFPLHLINQNNLEQGDMLSDTFQLYDLSTIGKTNGLTDAEAEAILKCTQPNILGIKEKELFDINAVTLHVNAVRSGNTITLNAVSVAEMSYVFIPALPNNKYELNSVVSGDSAVISVAEFYNNIKLKETYSMQGLNKSLITTANTNRVQLRFWNSATTGIKTWTDISFKLKQ